MATTIGPEARPRATLATVFSWSLYPAIMGGAVAAAIWLMGHGVHPILVLAAVMLVAFAVIICGERLFVYRATWSRSRGDVAVDAGHLVVVAASGMIAQSAAALFATWLAASLAQWIDIRIWPRHWPLVLQLATALVLVEFLHYWTHRLQHRFEWAWRFHAVHHSAPRLYWLNAGRFHFVDPLMHKLTGHLPLVALGGGVELFVLLELFTLLSGLLQHANLQIRLGPLNWIFSSSELHRWHHSSVAAEANHNFGRNLILWDIVFGTRLYPSDREPPERVGLEALDAYPMSFWAQLVSPLRWRRIQRASRAVAQRPDSP
jgi:sterol desaturase/sphingolipid hydroxylase (fatty acid hydroxylase superfamily)